MKKIIFTLLLSVTSLFTFAEKSKTDEVLEEAVKKAIHLAEQTGQFVMEQTPELVQEFYTWHYYKDISLICLWSFLIVGIIILIVLEQKDKFDTDGTITFFGAMLITAFAFFDCILIFDLLKLTTAPKLYLIEYFIY